MSALSGVALLCCLGIKGLPLHKVTDEAWNLKDDEKTITNRAKSEEEAGSSIEHVG